MAKNNSNFFLVIRFISLALIFCTLYFNIQILRTAFIVATFNFHNSLCALPYIAPPTVLTTKTNPIYLIYFFLSACG